MKTAGILFIIWAAAGWYLLRRKQETLSLRLGQALLDDLLQFRYQVCIHRVSLPAILSGILTSGLGAAYFWMPLRHMIEAKPNGSRRSLPQCWMETAMNLPEPLSHILSSLGPFVPAGGDVLGKAIDEAREELTGFLRGERERQAMAGRLTAALCLSAACLLILVLI